VTEAEQKLNLAVNSAQQSAQRADQQIAALQNRLAAQDEQLKTLNNKVAQIDQKLSFGGAADLSLDLQNRLARVAEAYLNYFKKLGYAPKTPTINVSTKGAVPNFLSYFDPATNTIFVQPPVAEDQFVLLREYSHHILYSSLSFGAFDNLHSSNFSLIPLESGLANYFSASYLGNPRLGAIAARYMKSTTQFEKPFLFNLDNTETVTTLVIKDFRLRLDNNLQEAWGGLFWEIRQKLGQAIADKLLYDAWRSLPDEPNDLIAGSFIADLLSQTQKQTGKDGTAAVEQILLRRGLKQSALTAPTKSQ
jgi:uncharacterized coiled-coil protein SlyX